MRLPLFAFSLALLCTVLVFGSFVSQHILISEEFVLLRTYVIEVATLLAVVALVLSCIAAVYGVKRKSRVGAALGFIGILFSVIALLPSVLALIVAMALARGGGIPR